MSIEFGRRVELEGLWDAGQLPGAVVDGVGKIVGMDGKIDEGKLEKYKVWLQDAWDLIRDKNRDKINFAGNTYDFGDFKMMAQIGWETGACRVSLMTDQDNGEVREKTLITFHADWLNLKCGLSEVYIGMTRQDSVSGRTLPGGVTAMRIDFVGREVEFTRK